MRSAPTSPRAGRGRRLALAIATAAAVVSWPAARPSAQPQPVARFFPIAVWYGGGKARPPMLERDARAKKEAWRRDVQQIKALGFNTLRAWIDWATGEPDEGRYDFETLDVLLELVEEEGLRLVLQVYMDSAPQWVGRRFPDSLYVSSNGQAIRPESSPGYCRDHAGVRAADVAFYAALARRAAGSPAFLGWDLWSEPHVINWATPTWIPNPEFCFCPHTLQRFRTWLKAKYGTLDALNAAWYRRFTTWHEVEPSRMSTILSYTDYIDWKSFIAAKLGEDLRDRHDAVKPIAPAAVVTSHAATVGMFASPHHWEGQADDWTMAGQVDFYGTSFYPKHSASVDRDWSWRAALLDFTRSFGFAGGRPGFWVGELQGGFGTIALNVSRPVTADDLRVWTWTALSRGAKGISYYAWRPMASGYESGGFGLNELDGTITDRARAAGAIARLVDRHRDLFLAARPPRAPVAVVYNPLSHFVGGRQRATAYGGPQGEVIGIERDSLLGVHRALLARNMPVDFVHLGHATAASLRDYPLVYLPYPLMLPAGSASVLAQYVRDGGTLVAEARLAWNDERGTASDRIPGHGLAEVMGARERTVESAPKERTTLAWTSPALPGLEPGARLPGRMYKEVLEPIAPAARVVAEFEDGAPAAVMSTYGRGRTLLLGSYVSAAHQSTPTADGERFFFALLAWAGVSPALEVTGAPLEARQLDAGDAALLFLFNHGTSPARSRVSLQHAGTSAQDLATGEIVALQRGQGAVSVDVHLPPAGVQVLRISAPR